MKKRELKKMLEIEQGINASLISQIAELLLDNFASKQEMTELAGDLPEVEEVILNGPATIVKWVDGTKTVSKARGGDKYDPVFGMLACIVRKLTGNRGHMVDEYEPCIRDISSSIESVADIDDLIAWGDVILSMLVVLRDSVDVWGELLMEDEEGEEVVELEQPPLPIPDLADNGKVSEEMRDAIRQEIRNLYDDGEL